VNANDLREVFETVLPAEALQPVIAATKLQERERKLNAQLLLRAMIIAAATGYGGRQADVMRQYFELGAERVVRGGFYAWFGRPLEQVMESIRDRALGYIATQSPDLQGWLGEHVRDWHIVDSSTVKLDARLKQEYPGAGDYAALKVHKRFSVGIGTAVAYHLSPARDHDAPHLTIDESWRGLGLLADLGYASLKLLRDCASHEVRYVIRLKENWKPRVQIITRGTLRRTFAPGTDLDLLLADETLVLDGSVVDARVQMGAGPQRIECRLVGVPRPDGDYGFYLTNLPGVIGPRQIADLYRVRWEIEMDNKLDKSCNALDKIGARTGPAVRALVHASMVSSMLVGLLAHHHRRREAPPAHANTERVTAPIHPQSLARAMGSAAQSLAGALDLTGAAADRRWRELAAHLTHLGKDPNWRNRPSILDQLRGWRISPGRPRKARTASVPRVKSAGPGA
jgi:hypothetical protein